jgi:hypothetical protein
LPELVRTEVVKLDQVAVGPDDDVQVFALGTVQEVG